MRWRQLVRDYEERWDLSEVLIYLAMGRILIRRICNP